MDSEVVGVDGGVPKMLLRKYFILSQGYNITESIMYKENKSRILLENNGKCPAA